MLYKQQYPSFLTYTNEPRSFIDVVRMLSVCSYESGILEDPNVEGPADIYQMTTDPCEAPSKPEKLEIEFKNGTRQF